MHVRFFWFNQFFIAFATWITILFAHDPILGQTAPSLTEKERVLATLFHETLTLTDMPQLISMADSFAHCFYQTLADPLSFDFSFDSLKTLSKLTSPNGKIRVYSWNIPLQNGTQRFYGMVQTRLSTSGKVTVTPLHENRNIQATGSDTLTLDSKNWFGAVYYQMIPVTSATGQPLYTLLGWHGVNPLLSGKVIEILWFDQNDQPAWGYPLFCQKTPNAKHRMIFWHSARNAMILRYEEQYLTVSQRWNTKKKRYKPTYKQEFMIVCDHLAPENPQLEGQYEYYVPNGERMDGYIYRDHCWDYVTQVETRNLKEK